jgi:hypothetical protein
MRDVIGTSFATLATVTLLLTASHGQEIRSAKAMLPYCTAALQPNAQDPNGGRCMGILATLSFVSRVLPDNLKFCQPSGATPDVLLQAIGSFVEANPDAAEQDFRLVALAAMRSKWPCQD